MKYFIDRLWDVALYFVLFAVFGCVSYFRVCFLKFLGSLFLVFESFVCVVLFIFHEFKVFAVDLAEVLDNYEKSLFTFKLKLFYQNFTNNLNKICVFNEWYIVAIVDGMIF